MAISKQAFSDAAAAAIVAYPALVPLFRARDPRLLAKLDAIAAMLAMMSESMDAAEFEPFEKVRDGTVLADATLKGILPLARPATVTITATNTAADPFAIVSGRRIVDATGRVFSVDSGVTVPAGGVAVLTAVQRTVRAVTHNVAPGGPFYRIPVPAPSEPVFLSELTVAGPGGVFDYRPDYCNVLPGDRAYQAETDERRALSIVFGKTGITGYQPATGDTFTLTIEECEGFLSDLSAGSAFAFESASTAAEGQIRMALATVVDAGQNPPTIEELRQIARYPALYDHNAVFLGNFAELLRRYMTGIVFLSVWNEQIEERARGPSVDNINRLFVAGIVTSLPGAAFNARALDLIRRADDSYRVSFVPVREFPVPLTIIANVSVVHDPSEVEAQIRALVLSLYGRGAKGVSFGGAQPINSKALGARLAASVPALRDQISDLQIVARPPSDPKPEDFLYVSPESLTVQITQAAYNTGLWNY